MVLQVLQAVENFILVWVLGGPSSIVEGLDLGYEEPSRRGVRGGTELLSGSHQVVYVFGLRGLLQLKLVLLQRRDESCEVLNLCEQIRRGRSRGGGRLM